MLCDAQTKACGLDDAGSSNAGSSEVSPFCMSFEGGSSSLVEIIGVLIRGIFALQHIPTLGGLGNANVDEGQLPSF